MSISNCGHDERWQYAGGMAGDNNGTEWGIVPWYAYPWDVMLRYPNAEVRHWMGDQARAAAMNNHIGYDQWQRQTFWVNLEDSNYDCNQITVDCETDCSAGVLAIAKAAGYHFGIDALKRINQNGYTGNEESILTGAGFIAYRGSQYLTSGNYLDNGDILLNTQNHTAFNITRGNFCDAPEGYQNFPSQPVNMNDLYYHVHVQTYANLPIVRDGQWAGTKGKKKRIEGLWINPPEGVAFDVEVHLQGVGWKPPVRLVHGNDILLGSTGECRRLEAVRINVVRNDIGKELRMQGHVQTYGDTAIVGEGMECGTTGAAKRLEAIRLWME